MNGYIDVLKHTYALCIHMYIYLCIYNTCIIPEQISILYLEENPFVVGPFVGPLAGSKNMFGIINFEGALPFR